MNDNIINFYIIANRLKEKIRTGWQEIEVSSQRLESVAEHIYGCLMLAIAIDSEYKLNLDMYKVLKMISLHELEETIMKDYTVRDNITKEEKIKRGKECVIKATEGMIKQDEIVRLLDEFNERLTKESIFCYHIDKIECDFQAKIYDLKGQIKMENMLEDLKYYGEEGTIIKTKVNVASDVWIECDKKIYMGDKIFESLINDIQKITN
jgi:5'-deoxynucleotidase YfbR-like HD superfamily hydrolase